MQSACIDQAVSDGANAILIAANSADGVNESLKKAAEAGCKIVYVDSAASYDCVTALATDNVAGIGRTVYRYKYKDGYGCCCHYERVYVRGRRNEDKIQV